MSIQTWVETLVSAQVAGAAVTTNLADTSMLPAQAVYTIPANYFYIGKVLRVKAWGQVSNIVTTPGTLTLKFMLGTLATPIIVFNGGAMQLNAVAKTNVSWQLDLMMTCRAVGSGTSANLLGQGDWTSESVVGSPLPSAGGSGSLNMPASAPAVGTGFDSTIANVANLTANFSLTGNSITVMEYTLEAMN